MKFRDWLENLTEAKLDPTALKRDVYRDIYGSTKKTYPQNSFSLTLDNNGNVVRYDYNSNKPHLTINPKVKSIDLQKLSPQSSEFHKIIKALKSKYQDINDWEINHYFMAGHLQPGNHYDKRKVGYYLKEPSIVLNNKLPKYLYHGTSTNLWYDGISQKGLSPRKATGSSGTYGSQNVSSLSQDDLVYLSGHPDFATREAGKQASQKHGGLPLILRIDGKYLDPNKLQPDEDTRSNNPQGSFNISSTLAYKGNISVSGINTFLIGKKNIENNRIKYKWEPFNGVEISEHPLTALIKSGQTPYKDDPNYYALKDAGIIDQEKVYNDDGHSYTKDVIKKPDVSDQEIKAIIKNSSWTQNVRLIIKDINDAYSGTLYSIKSIPNSTSFTPQQEKIINMLLDSGLVFNSGGYFDVHSWNPENGAIKLAKLMGRMNFQELTTHIKNIARSNQADQY